MEDSEIIKALECCSANSVDACQNCAYRFESYENGCAFQLSYDALGLIHRQKAEIEALQMDNEQLKTDICNARMNLKHIRELYEERADLCEEQERQILELDFILANYPYMVHFGNGTMCAENHKEYERLLASISANAVNEALEELKNTLVINNEGNTEFFDYVYTLETIEELKIKR